MTTQDLRHQFSYHTPTLEQIARMQTIRESALAFATIVLLYTPAGADQSSAIRKIRECVMTANAAIVLEQDPATLDDIQANAFVDLFKLFGKGFTFLFGGLFTSAQVQDMAKQVSDFVTTDVGKLALDAVQYVESTFEVVVYTTDAEKKAASVAKRDEAVAKLKTDAAAAGKDLSSFASSSLIWFVETALQYLVAKGLAAASDLVLKAQSDQSAKD